MSATSLISESDPRDTLVSTGEQHSEAATAASEQITIIRPAEGWLALNLIEVWHYRDLLFLLIWRDVSARYRQSVAGYAWAIIKPVLSMLVFTFIFGSVARIDSGTTPYPLIVFSGLLPWMYFTSALSGASASVVSGGALISKVYFPRLILPLASICTGIVDFAIQMVVMLLMMAWYGVMPGWQMALFPLFLLITLASALAGGLWLTALNVKYRDVGMAVPFFLQAWMWLSPVIYLSSNVPANLRKVYALNPMAGVIEGFRWSLLGLSSPDWAMMTISLAITLLLLVTGLYYFRRTEMQFTDIL